MYTITEVANKFSLSTSSLRYYEKVGLLPPIAKSSSGKRNYKESDIEYLEIIICLRKTGLSINRIRDFIHLQTNGQPLFSERIEILDKQRTLINQQIDDLNASKEKIIKKIEHYQRKLGN
ncbi:MULTISPECIES: MerR family transcriptional regulator [unclassified Enterococcus]|uniref:MerR family transcriptional regulator n=1 Tax=unclassified Enterococcus TaxID=2608891 RepID=UPI001CE150BD|nr:MULTISPECIES: MerR family transcriptional regulator [unclassified Enterococcus]MCA5013674.1 MerR family transcriptional regulator [Enterococcus sp. S23]MCA5016924.1 MerR family transcriptional regulator [Enterococcus sp. S22(2020)]